MIFPSLTSFINDVLIPKKTKEDIRVGKKYTSGINVWEKNYIYSINCTLIIIQYLCYDEIKDDR